jgi:hypothetical protein
MVEINVGCCVMQMAQCTYQNTPKGIVNFVQLFDSKKLYVFMTLNPCEVHIVGYDGVQHWTALDKTLVFFDVKPIPSFPGGNVFWCKTEGRTTWISECIGTLEELEDYYQYWEVASGMYYPNMPHSERFRHACISFWSKKFGTLYNVKT